jgi:AmmeMemoRadiSam system protein B
MPLVRRPAVASTFYPASAVELESVVQLLLAGAPLATGAPPKAIVAPHAGYAYSGPIAASAYARAKALRGRIERVVMLGPAHYMPVGGIHTSGFESFTTPMGELEVDRDASRSVEHLASVARCDTTHAIEHSLEVQLPFVISTFGRVKIVPIVVGGAGDDEVARVLDTLWGGDETLVVVSSDLSHDLPYEAAKRRDQETSRAIEALDERGVPDDAACGGASVRGLLLASRDRRLKVETLDVRSSGDTTGEHGNVVGYGAYALVA